jgi:hypothetical protein
LAVALAEAFFAGAFFAVAAAGFFAAVFLGVGLLVATEPQ